MVRDDEWSAGQAKRATDSTRIRLACNSHPTRIQLGFARIRLDLMQPEVAASAASDAPSASASLDLRNCSLGESLGRTRLAKQLELSRAQPSASALMAANALRVGVGVGVGSSQLAARLLRRLADSTDSTDSTDSASPVAPSGRARTKPRLEQAQAASRSILSALGPSLTAQSMLFVCSGRNSLGSSSNSERAARVGIQVGIGSRNSRRFRLRFARPFGAIGSCQRAIKGFRCASLIGRVGVGLQLCAWLGSARLKWPLDTAATGAFVCSSCELPTANCKLGPSSPLAVAIGESLARRSGARVANSCRLKRRLRTRTRLATRNWQLRLAASRAASLFGRLFARVNQSRGRDELRAASCKRPGEPIKSTTYQSSAGPRFAGR